MTKQKKNNQIKPRMEIFTWATKQELIIYFKKKYDMESVEIEKRIDIALKTFKLRKGRPIDPKELWQKVGISILKEQNYMKKD